MARALFLSLLLAGCSASAPAPISYGGAAAPRTAPRAQAPRVATEAPPPERPRPATPEPDWAASEGTPLSAYALRPEEVQPYDPARTPRTHRVGENESLYDIATAYQIPLRALIDQNRLEPPFALTPGRELELPPPRFHRVARGERFEDVARAYNVDLRSLALLNRMQPPYTVREGDQIVLPALARARPAPPPIAQTPVSITPAAPSGPARFMWPLRGEIVARFGPQAGGRRSDGIEIAARDGTPVAAAADGDVVYSGSDLSAYGTLILIRHTGNYVTAYGYAARSLVREGQRVRASETIAEMGDRGRLMFQVRQGTAATDPLPLLGGN